MDDAVRRNRTAWESAAEKYVREHGDLLREARETTSLFPDEVDLLRPLLRSAPTVVHLQSGHGLDDVALVAAGARTVIGVDYSAVTTGAAHRRATELGLACRYVVAELPGAPLRDGCADLVFNDCFVNDSFPGNGAVEWQWTLGEIVNAMLAAGLEPLHLAEHPEPFWRPGGITAAAWSGRLPNAFSLLARRRPEPAG